MIMYYKLDLTTRNEEKNSRNKENCTWNTFLKKSHKYMGYIILLDKTGLKPTGVLDCQKVVIFVFKAFRALI